MVIGDNKYNNLYFLNKFKVTDVFSKLFVSNDVGRRLGPCICTGCSKVIDNIPVFRIFNDHGILFNKLEKINIRPRLIRVLKALYSSARISVDINDSSINVNRGVLQGSILSPFLFNLYINDLIEKIKKVAFEVLAYADDIAILCSCEKEINLVIDVVDRQKKTNLF